MCQSIYFYFYFFLGGLCVCDSQDVLWCPILQVKSLQPSPYVFMPVRLLDSSSPAVSTPRGITSGLSGTPACRPHSLVRLLMSEFSSSSIIRHIIISIHLHNQDHNVFQQQFGWNITFIKTYFLVLFVCYREQWTSYSALQQLCSGGSSAQGSPPVSFCCQLSVLSFSWWSGFAQSLAPSKRAWPGRRLAMTHLLFFFCFF